MSVETNDRVAALERQLNWTRGALIAICLVGGLLVMGAMVRGEPEVSKEIRTRRLVVVDDKGVERVVIGQDPVDGQRRSRAAGITIYDGTGAERGGMCTFDDKSVVIALDAPTGVGNPMRDRLGLQVGADGSSSILLIDNETKGVVRLFSDGKGKGGPQVFKWDDVARKVHVKTFGFDGETVDVQDRGK